MNFQRKTLVRGAFCKWIERFVSEVANRRGTNSTVTNNETRSSAVNNRLHPQAVFGARYGSTPVSNVTIDAKVN